MYQTPSRSEAGRTGGFFFMAILSEADAKTLKYSCCLVLKATIAADLCRQQRQGSICVLALWCVVRDASEPTVVGSNWQFLKEANANRVITHRRQFLAELVVATIVADGTEGNLALLCFTLCLAYFGSEPTGAGSGATRGLLCHRAGSSAHRGLALCCSVSHLE